MRILLAISALLCASAAVAEPRLGTHYDRTHNEVTTAFTDGVSVDPRQVADRLGKCIADYNKARTAKIMGLPLLSKEQNKSFRELSTASDECFMVQGGELQVGWLTVVGRMAEHRFERMYKSADVNALVAASASIAPRTPMEEFAFCLVRANPAGAARLIATPIASRDEESAVQALAPDLEKCMPAGPKATLNVSAARDIYAAGLYLLATRPAAS
jgi:hypothetical protein